jgi:hypothetical protein
MHFWVWGILWWWSECVPITYEVVRDCWKFEKHCSRHCSFLSFWNNCIQPLLLLPKKSLYWPLVTQLSSAEQWSSISSVCTWMQIYTLKLMLYHICCFCYGIFQIKIWYYIQHIVSKNVIPVILHSETVYSPVICNNIDLYCVLHVALEVDFINVRDFVMFSAVRVVQILATIKEHEHCSLLKER